MRVSKIFLVIGLILSGCALSPQKKGTVTVEGIGTKVLTEKGDQLMGTGFMPKERSRLTLPKGTRRG